MENKNTFINALKNNQNMAKTENGENCFLSTNDKNVDFFSMNFRAMNDSELIKAFLVAYYENKKLAILNLLHLLDIRGGKGERVAVKIITNELFKDKMLSKVKPETIVSLGRFDYAIRYAYKLSHIENIANGKNRFVTFLKKQFNQDIENMKQGKPISLLAKWLPTNTNSIKMYKEKSINIYWVQHAITNMNWKDYTKTISSMRTYLNILEKKMCENKFSEIDYSLVPSIANKKYNNAFLNKDNDRRMEFLRESLKAKSSDNSKMANVDLLYPHNFIKMLDKIEEKTSYLINEKESVSLLYETFKKKGINKKNSIFPVCDLSGSMFSKRKFIEPYSVSVGMGIYLANINNGEFKNKLIEFGSKPEFVELTGNLIIDYDTIRTFGNCDSTNLELVYKLIFDTALKSKKEDVPKIILIISDMQFDSQVDGGTETIFNVWKEKFRKELGMKIPNVIYWNVGSYETFVATKDTKGVIMVSGYSKQILESLLSSDVVGNLLASPEKFMLETLNKYTKYLNRNAKDHYE